MERGRRSEEDIEFEPGGGEEPCCTEKRKLESEWAGGGGRRSNLELEVLLGTYIPELCGDTALREVGWATHIQISYNMRPWHCQELFGALAGVKLCGKEERI